MSDIIRFEDGSATEPSCTFTGTTWNAGMYLSAADTLGWATNGLERLRLDINGLFIILGDSSAGGLQVQNDDTDSSNQVGGIRLRHFNTAEESVSIITGQSTTTLGIVAIGGGVSDLNAATRIGFFTAANNTTLQGTERMRINATGTINMPVSLIVGTTIATAPGATLDIRGDARMGTATDTATSGDFVTGLTAAARLFYDQSVPSLTFYDSSNAVVWTATATAVQLANIASLETQVLTPAQITADQNNYNPGTGGFWRLTSDALRNITGIAGGTDGRELTIVNAGSNSIVLQHQNGSSTAGNRIISANALDLTLSADDTVMLIYDTTTSRWRILNSG